MTIFENMKLANKFLVSFTFIVLFPIMAGGLIGYSYMKENAINEAIYIAREKTLATRNVLNGKMETLRSIAYAIISMKKIEEYMLEDVPYSFEKLLEFKSGSYSELLRIRDIYFQDISSIKLISFNENTEEILPIIVKRDEYLTEDVIHDLQNSKVNESIKFNGKNTLNMTVGGDMAGDAAYYYNRKYLSGGTKYVIEITSPLNSFFSDLQKYTNHMCIIVKNDIILCDNENILLELGITEENFCDILYAYPDISGVIKVASQNYIFTCENINLADSSKIYFMHSMKSITQTIGKFRNIVFASMLISLVIFSFVSKKIISLILSRMDIVLNAMESVGNGNIFHIINLSGNDEISALADGFNNMTNKMIEFIDIIVKKQAATKDSEIKSLLNQIDAHFMHNILNAIKTLAEKDYNYAVADAITSLSRIMRYNTNWKSKHVLLKDELDYVKDYVTVMNVRFGGTILYKVSVDSQLYDLKVLKMLIQPLVENAILHGLFSNFYTGSILVKITKSGNRIEILVADSGIGMHAEKIKEIEAQLGCDDSFSGDENNKSIALKNISQRLALQYGQNSGVRIRSREGFYTVVTLSFQFTA